MAGAGYKTWSPGEVVTAANVGNYLQDQVTGVYASAAARGSAIGTAVSDGMLSYRTDDKALELYAGSAWQPVMAGRNMLINGSFEINQRNFTSTTTNGTYGLDRWFLRSNDTLATYSSQAFAPGDLEVAGGIAKNYARIVTSGQTATNTLTILRQSVEGVRTLAAKTATYSFWARAASGTPKITISLTQYFGGGSSNVETVATPQNLSTSWQRYSFTVNVPSIAGKTIGSGGYDALITSIFVSAGTDYPLVGFGIQSNTFDIWGVQLEEGSVATSFTRATNTLQGELAACQRYFYKMTSSYTMASGAIRSSTLGNPVIYHPVEMRVAPTFTASGTNAITVYEVGTFTSTAIGTFGATPRATILDVTSSGMTAGRAAVFNVTSGQTIEWSAEL